MNGPIPEWAAIPQQKRPKGSLLLRIFLRMPIKEHFFSVFHMLKAYPIIGQLVSSPLLWRFIQNLADPSNQNHEKKDYIESDYSSRNDQHKFSFFFRNLIR